MAGSGVHVRARPDLMAGTVVEHDALAHAGRRDRAHVGAGSAGVAEHVADARGDRLPVGVHIEVLAACRVGRLVMGPLARAGCDLLALLGEQQRPAASGARVDGQQVARAHGRPPPRSNTSGFTTAAGRLPASISAIAAATWLAPRASVSLVAPPMCGVISTPG